MGTFALTFDDGPDPVWTPRLLDVLEELDVRASFFPIASRACAFPQIVERMRASGHAVGLHCNVHERHTEHDERWLRADTKVALARLARLGVQPTVWRPPWGVQAPWTPGVAADYGLRLVGWSVDTHDWRGDSAQEMLAETADGIVDGAIVLAHDGIGPGAHRIGASDTVRYVEEVVTLGRARGLKPVALDDGGLDDALCTIAATAAERDRDPNPGFPSGAFALLGATGALAMNAVSGPQRPAAAHELDTVRRVAAADGSVGRIFDGHLNAVERLMVQAPEGLREAELPALRAGTLTAGVWGGEPRRSEGPPATIEVCAGAEVLSGVRTFCSGAGGLTRALVLARDPDADAPAAVWLDLTDPATVEIDTGWYRSSGLRASVSHRVHFRRTPILARFGPPGALTVQPWFGRDALRTAASWAGMADCAAGAALDELAQRPGRGDLEAIAAGRILAAQATIDAWLARAASAMDGGGPEIAGVALHARAAIVASAQELLGEAARACGSHPFATGGALDRARRDIELFTLQHRLDPAIARSGAAALDARADGSP